MWADRYRRRFAWRLRHDESVWHTSGGQLLLIIGRYPRRFSPVALFRCGKKLAYHIRAGIGTERYAIRSFPSADVSPQFRFNCGDLRPCSSPMAAQNRQTRCCQDRSRYLPAPPCRGPSVRSRDAAALLPPTPDSSLASGHLGCMPMLSRPGLQLRLLSRTSSCVKRMHMYCRIGRAQ
jgi:hypothetical protein